MELIGAVGVCEMYVVRIGKLMKLMEWANSSLVFGEFWGDSGHDNDT